MDAEYMDTFREEEVAFQRAPMAVIRLIQTVVMSSRASSLDAETAEQMDTRDRQFC